MIRSRFGSICILLATLAGPGVGEAGAVGIWHRDYASGLAEAKAEGKDLLVVFTGTDWIEICGKFHDEILGDPAFIEAVSAKFALVKLEYPKDNRLPRGELAEKALLREAYRVRGFPTVLLTDASGRPFGVNGYQPVTAREYADQILGIDAAREQGIAMAEKAASLSGVDRARELVKSLPDVPDPLLARFFGNELRAIIGLDPGDELKIRGRFERILAEEAYGREMQKLARESNWDGMIALTDRHIEDRKLEGADLQGALLNRAGVERRAGKAAQAEATLRRVVAIDPGSEIAREAARLLEAATGAGEGAAVR
jgi:hypothetical protein